MYVKYSSVRQCVMQTKKDEKITFPPLIIKEITPCLFLYMSTLQSDFLGEFH